MTTPNPSAEPPSPAMSVVSGTTTLYAHLGDPIHVVRSPFIYNPWFRAQRIDAAVVPMGVHSGDLPAAVAMLRAVTNVGGLIVTMPHKLAVVPLLDSVSDAVRFSAKTDPVKVVMVKHPHPSNVKRNVRPFTITRCRNVVGHVDRHLWRHRNIL